MTDIEDLIESSDEYSHNDLLAGGDSSDHGPADNRLLCYAVTTIRESELTSLNEAVEDTMKDYLGLEDVSGVEIHAKSIWNGSERQKTPFKDIRSKD